MQYFAWSKDPAEPFTGTFTSRDDALAAGRALHPGVTLHTGIMSNFATEDFLPSGHDIIEQMKSRAEEEAHEYADAWLTGLDIEQVADLGQRVRTAIKSWVDDQCQHPSFYLVTDLHAHLALENDYQD